MAAALTSRLLDVIEHDVLPLTERAVADGNKVFGLNPGGYRHTNKFWTAYAIGDLIDDEPEPLRTRLRGQRDLIRSRYDALSTRYQETKADNNIPLN